MFEKRTEVFEEIHFSCEQLDFGAQAPARSSSLWEAAWRKRHFHSDADFLPEPGLLQW